MIPDGAAIRVVGDVHGEARAFSYAVATERFVVQLGDLTDRGPNSAGALRIALDMVDAGRGLFLLGNHDHKLARALLGQKVRIDAALAATLAELDADLRARTLAAIERAPAWVRRGRAFFVHGGFHTAMLTTPPPQGIDRAEGILSRALYGQTTGRRQPDGYPERLLGWIDYIPAGMIVYCGHDVRSTDGRPWHRRGALGGEAVFVDTGASKGGHLSWIDI